MLCVVKNNIRLFVLSVFSFSNLRGCSRLFGDSRLQMNYLSNVSAFYKFDVYRFNGYDYVNPLIESISIRSTFWKKHLFAELSMESFSWRKSRFRQRRGNTIIIRCGTNVKTELWICWLGMFSKLVTEKCRKSKKTNRWWKSRKMRLKGNEKKLVVSCCYQKKSIIFAPLRLERNAVKYNELEKMLKEAGLYPLNQAKADILWGKVRKLGNSWTGWINGLTVFKMEKVSVIIERNNDGSYTVIPQGNFGIGFFGQGNTVEEAVADLENSRIEAKTFQPELPEMKWVML